MRGDRFHRRFLHAIFIANSPRPEQYSLTMSRKMTVSNTYKKLLTGGCVASCPFAQSPTSPDQTKAGAGNAGGAAITGGLNAACSRTSTTMVALAPLDFQWPAERTEFLEMPFGGNGRTDAWGQAGDSRTGGHHIITIS